MIRHGSVFELFNIANHGIHIALQTRAIRIARTPATVASHRRLIFSSQELIGHLRSMSSDVVCSQSRNLIGTCVWDS